MKESKGKHLKQQDEEKRDVTYSHMAQNVERTRAMVRNSVSRVSTILAEK